MKTNNKSAPASNLPRLVVFIITLIAAAVAGFEALAGYSRAIRNSAMPLRNKIAHSVAALWVTTSRVRSGWAASRQAR